MKLDSKSVIVAYFNGQKNSHCLQIMKIVLVTIGDELLNGDIVNTNAAWMSRQITDLGGEVHAVETIGDSREQLLDVLSRSVNNAEVVLLTGGLGPTHDDITKKVICEFCGDELILDEPTLDFVKLIFERMELPFSSSNYDQAMVPSRADVLRNEKGTAPGLWMKHGDAVIVAMPGVPVEMKHLMKTSVIPRLGDEFTRLHYSAVAYLQTAGIGESTLSDLKLSEVVEGLSEYESLAFLPHQGAITLRITARSPQSIEEAEQMVNRIKKQVYEAAKDEIFGEGKETSLASAIGVMLTEKNKTISVAESCTGGMIGAALTDIPGSSRYFSGGVIAYSNDVKQKELSVPEDILKKHGAVSAETAVAMAMGVRDSLNTDIGISTTGVAGPDGGTEEKPVGTVWFGFADAHEAFAVKAHLTKDRDGNRIRSVNFALDLVRRVLQGCEKLPYELQKVRV